MSTTWGCRPRAAILVWAIVACGMMPAAAAAQGTTGGTVSRESASPPSVTDAVTPLTVSELAAACDSAQHRNASVARFCMTPLSSISGTPPTVLEIRCLLLPAHQESRHPECAAIAQELLLRESASASPGSVFAGSGAAFESEFLGAATDVLVARAEDAIKVDIMREFYNRTCKDDGETSGGLRVKDLLTETCASVNAFANQTDPDSVDRYQNPLPGLATIRASFRRDLLAAPERADSALQVVRAQIVSSSTDARYAQVVVALSAVHMVRGVAAGQAVSRVLRESADSLGRDWANSTKAPHTNEQLQVLTTAVGVAGSVDFPVPGIGAQHSLTPTEIARAADLIVRTTVISVVDPVTVGWPMVTRQWLRNPQAADVAKLRMVAESGSRLAQAFSELPTLDEIRKMSPAERRTIVVKEMAELAPTITAMIPDATMPAIDKQRIIRFSSLAAHIAGEDYASIVNDLVQAGPLFDDGTAHLLSPRAQAFLRVAAEVALAQDGDALRAAMENAIAPPERYLAKRVNDPVHRVWINSYVGIAGGAEHIIGAESWSHFRPAVGAALPVGIELDASRTIAFFLPIIDLGQVLNYRLGDTTTVRRDPPGLTIQTVFSPGAFVVVRPGPFFYRRPYAFLLGASYSPNMRERRIGADLSPADAFRASLALAVDVPIFP